VIAVVVVLYIALHCSAARWADSAKLNSVQLHIWCAAHDRALAD